NLAADMQTQSSFQGRSCASAESLGGLRDSLEQIGATSRVQAASAHLCPRSSHVLCIWSTKFECCVFVPISSRQPDDVLARDLSQPLGPCLKRRAFFGCECVMYVDSHGDACATARMIRDMTENVRCDAHRGHRGEACSTQIVNGPALASELAPAPRD